MGSEFGAPPAAPGFSDTGGGTFMAKTQLLGLRGYVILAIAAGILVTAFVTCFLFRVRRNNRKKNHLSRVEHAPSSSGLLPPVTNAASKDACSGARQHQLNVVLDAASTSSTGTSSWSPAMSVGCGKTGRDGSAWGWGRWYEMAEMEAATEGFKAENVIGEGGYGIVYRGLLPDGEVVAVKDLFDNKGQAEQEFKVEVEAIGKVSHKNLVGLIGYCDEGPKRILIYEYVNNGNLEQWLHGDVGQISPLTWEIRMKIAIGTAKGIAYLHEGLEPKVVHRDIKSSNILLDKHWNPKVSDFGMAKLLGSESSYVTTRVMGTFGYVAPEYASTGMLNESSDIYSFGILLMELITGRSPVDYNRPAGEVNLVDWFKGMVGSRRIEELVDPLMEVPPPPRVLNRVVLVCLRCIDIEAQKRPKMGQVVHMLEGDEFPFRAEHRSPRATRWTTSNVQSSSRLGLLSENVGLGDTEKSMLR